MTDIVKTVPGDLQLPIFSHLEQFLFSTRPNIRMATSVHLQECLNREIRYTLPPIFCHGLILCIYQTAEWAGGQGGHDQNQNALRGGSQARDQPQTYDGQQNYQQVNFIQHLVTIDNSHVARPTGVSAAATAGGTAAEFFLRRRGLSPEPGDCRSAPAKLSAAAVQLCGQSAKLPAPRKSAPNSRRPAELSTTRSAEPSKPRQSVARELSKYRSSTT